MFKADSHNFGKRVTEGRCRLYKPRTIFWEWLILGKSSRVNRLLRKVAFSPFSSLASLDFTPDDNRFLSGHVEKLVLDSTRASTKDLERGLASTYALALSLGIADLHF